MFGRREGLPKGALAGFPVQFSPSSVCVKDLLFEPAESLERCLDSLAWLLVEARIIDRSRELALLGFQPLDVIG